MRVRSPLALHLLSAPVLAVFVAAGAALGTDPTTLVENGADDFTLAGRRVIWHTAAGCTETPDHGPVLGAEDPEVLTRIATYGGTPRVLFLKNEPRPPDVCNPYEIYSEILADSGYVYWVDATGLVRLEHAANPGDPVELVTDDIAGTAGGRRRLELAQDEGSVFVLTHDRFDGAHVWSAPKGGGAASQIANVGAPASDLQADGEYLYWLTGGNLRRLSFTRGLPVTTIATGVTGYYPEGRREPPRGTATSYVYYGQGNRVLRYNNTTATTSVIYTSGAAEGRIYSLVTDASQLFFLERLAYTPPGDVFVRFQQSLLRTGRGGGTAEALWFRTSQIPAAWDADGLTHALVFRDHPGFLFWRVAGSIQRLPSEAEAFPLTNLRPTGLEVTQGIQNLENSVLLVEGRRTLVRLHVRSDGPPVPGVTAILSRVLPGGRPIGEPLAPVNTPGTHLTVQPSPDRSVLDASFLFELPWDWLQDGLRLCAELNPYRMPPEVSYADNAVTAGPFQFEPSPRLEVYLIAFGHEIYGTVRYPRYVEDVLETFSYIRRTYPIATGHVPFGDPTPGLSTRVTYVFDEELGPFRELGPVDYYNSSLGHVIRRLIAWEAAYGGGRFYYGMFEGAAGNGQAGVTLAAGTAGEPIWCVEPRPERDASAAGRVAAHEIAHLLGRYHPHAAANCQNSGSDLSYPYTGGFIGPPGGSLAGFDAGASFLEVPRAVLPGNLWKDFMTYCTRQWISDYTYESLYSAMAASGMAGGAEGGGGGKKLPGDWLLVVGDLDLEGGATIRHLRRMDEVASIPERDPGSYAIRLLDASGALLADYAFAPEPPVHDGAAGAIFGEVVPFVAGTREVRIVEGPEGRVLAAVAVSANPPQVAGVELVGAASPVTGTMTVAWSAADPDGDPLTFDVLYSREGESFQPLRLGARGEEAEIDTSRLGGGSAVVRVVATDGVLSAHADSPPFLVAVKPPEPRLVSPADGARIQWGQLASFIGEADDLQDGGVPARRLFWTRGQGEGKSVSLGSGPLLAVADLPVGTHEIRLTALNRSGLSASASVTVTVHDDLRLPGPTLAAGPLQVAWEVAGAAAGPVTARVQVVNAGEGSLAWTATEDASWLSLDRTSGVAPAALTLTADPAGLPADRMYSTDLVLAAPGGDGEPPQTVTVAVSLVVGDPRAGAQAGGLRLPGDGNGDGRLDLSDGVHLLRFLFQGTVSRLPCGDGTLGSAGNRLLLDTNGDERVDLSDAVRIFAYLFQGARPPVLGTRCVPVPDCAERCPP